MKKRKYLIMTVIWVILIIFLFVIFNSNFFKNNWWKWESISNKIKLDEMKLNTKTEPLL